MKLVDLFKVGRVQFCDSCASVCDDRCRIAAIRESALDRRVRFGGWI
jgi:hypothetical protein